MAAVTVIFLLVALVAVHALGRLRWKGLTTLGALTYPVYLLHQTVSAIFIPAFDGHLNPWLIVAVTLAVALALSYLVWRYVEKPVQRLLKPHLAASLRALGAVSEKTPAPAPDPGQKPQRGYIHTVSVPELLGRDGRGTV
jgi:peptidoglycan/LPS O-acetylase OafA/YrhL